MHGAGPVLVLVVTLLARGGLLLYGVELVAADNNSEMLSELLIHAAQEGTAPAIHPTGRSFSSPTEPCRVKICPGTNPEPQIYPVLQFCFFPNLSFTHQRSRGRHCTRYPTYWMPI